VRSEAPVVSDFDGDGFSDLAIGASTDDRLGGVEGSVTIMYGPLEGGSEPRVERVTQLTADPEGPSGRDLFGEALAVGDFNGDGFADLAVGAPRRSEGEAFHSGSVYVFFGSPSGLSSGESAVLTQSDFSVPLHRQITAFFGSALATGDFDGDGADDLVIGAHGSYVKGLQSAGAIYVAMGGRGGLTPRSRITQASVGVPGRPATQAYFGWSLGIGRLGYGKALDLVVGVPGERDRAKSFVGAAFVFYGAGDGTFSRVQRIRHREVRVGTPGRLPAFGKQLVVADFGRSPHEDLAVAAPGEKGGVVHVLYARSAGVSLRRAQKLSVTSLGFRKRDSDYFGGSLSAGDLGRGPHGDLIVGNPSREARGKEGAGAAVVVYGGDKGLRATSGQLVTRSKLVGRPPHRQANFSSGLAVGDFSANGRCGLAVGAPGAYSETKAGEEVLVTPGAPRGPRRGSAARWDQRMLFGEGERDPYDQFGAALASSCEEPQRA